APDAGEIGWTETPAARQRITEAATAARPVIICAHRQNLPWLLAHACAAIGAPAPDGPALQRGAFWVLQVGGQRLASARQRRHGAGPGRAGGGGGRGAGWGGGGRAAGGGGWAAGGGRGPAGPQPGVAGTAPSNPSSRCWPWGPVPPLSPPSPVPATTR